MPGRLVLLGTGTCELGNGRAASAVLVELSGTRLVFDFGRGIATRLSQCGLAQDDVEHVVLSHYHPDHFSDLIPYLHAALHAPGDRRTKDLHLYGPPGLDAVIGPILALSGMTATGGEAPFGVELHDLRESVRIGSLVLHSCDLPPAGNRGLRFAHEGATCALTGDSHYHDGEVEFLRDVEYAVIDSGHLCDDEIVELAVRSRVALMICSHLYRELDIAGLQARAEKEGYAGRLLQGVDLMEVTLG